MKAAQADDAVEARTLALVPWGDVFEDFYGSIGVSFDKYCSEFTGSWHIGLIHALKSRRIRNERLLFLNQCSETFTAGTFSNGSHSLIYSGTKIVSRYH